MHFLFALIENAVCYVQVGVKKAVHPIRFASDSRIALLAAVSNPPGVIASAHKWGRSSTRCSPFPRLHLFSYQ